MENIKKWTDPFHGIEHYKFTNKSIYITVATFSESFVVGSINNHNEGGGGFTSPVAKLVGKSTENMKRRLLKIAKKYNLIYQ